MREPGLLKPAVLWLLLLAPLFFSTYGFATWVTSQRSDVGTLVFDWESHMPFWAWTIVPYWSIDLLYGFSLLLPNSRHELKQHALRLLSAQIIAVSCFLIWPLRFTFERPELDGVFGWLFAVLAGFDKPFNQAPSLHIALLVILWVMYQRHTQGAWRWVVHGWFALIGISVLTTYQHHFIDLPTGALAGWLCVWLWPVEHPSPLLNARLARDPKRWRLGLRYGLGALALATAALKLGGGWLWLLWPAVSLGLVSANYAVLGAVGFQKRSDGRLTPAARWLYAPYLAAAWINSRLWTRKHPQPDLIVDNVWLGRIPTTSEQTSFKAIVDLCAELPIYPQGRAYQCIAVLDLTAPTPAECLQAAQAIERLRIEGPLLVCCALGYSRSATAVAAWLLHSGRAATVDKALAMIGTARTEVVLHPAHRSALEGLAHAR
ncbi:phosphatase PAP2/dual specificity phosphatase family protein [Pseudomonas sp. S1Bt30]|uniref:Phosphatase PAP2/dual specificity phosphatase family protein n=1 Tax=Pseudomonas quebecensis TaxID=2995174 RepID=A0ABY6QGJ8_9PSED|nr:MULTISPECIES: phosphatase PAP2/dual specificity phosphatase family protein [Pseudomonas]MCX4062752.1 phosphatase PAP2/dual specificity phosphatase family protein [Pseudomonas quebecensis]UZW18546.1 phosphatase PAP2/dual specificity phosphatase family protein [Pseudomonas quebecensis]UZW24040.1 phosphatase PAP2/dual specificity phosphatase family protein [Pseudomonas quebecensis]UZW29102.1 phosphatase PAP2/dual specificity phosphatase family protein [Pseudomonas quebecensis]